MLGHDHALSGALAFVAVAPLLPVSGTQLAVAAALTAGAGILPDLDDGSPPTSSPSAGSSPRCCWPGSPTSSGATSAARS